MVDRVPPHDYEAEKAVLGSILLNNDMFDEVYSRLEESHFYSATNATIFRLMTIMRAQGEPIDSLTLRNKAKAAAASFPPDFNPSFYIIELQDNASMPSAAPRHAERVRQCAVNRTLVNVGLTLQNIGFENPDDSEDALSTGISMLSHMSIANTDDSKEASEIADDFIERLKHGTASWMYVPGLPKVRMKAGDLLVLAAGTSVGKTALTLNWADEWSKQHSVTYFEYEMEEVDLMARLICKYAGVTMQQIQDGSLTHDEIQRVEEAAEMLKERNLRIKEVWCDINHLTALIRKEARNGTEVVIVDHLGLIPFKTPKGMNYAKAVGAMVTNQLKRLASELGIRIVLLVQMNRAGQSGDGFPKLHHLRDSGEIEQDASIVICAWSDKSLKDDISARTRIREDSTVLAEHELLSDEFNLIRLGVEKHRNGPLMDKWLIFHGERFEYEDRSEEELAIGDRRMF